MVIDKLIFKKTYRIETVRFNGNNLKEYLSPSLKGDSNREKLKKEITSWRSNSCDYRSCKTYIDDSGLCDFANSWRKLVHIYLCIQRPTLNRIRYFKKCTHPQVGGYAGMHGCLSGWNDKEMDGWVGAHDIKSLATKHVSMYMLLEV